MASLWAALGSNLQPDGLQPGRKRLAAKTSQQPFICQKILRVLAGAAAVTAAVTCDTVPPISRICYRKKNRGELAEEALRFKQQHTEGARYWQLAFLLERYGEMNSNELKKKRNELRSAIRKDGGTKMFNNSDAGRLAASSKKCRPENLAAFCVGKTKSALQPKSRCRDYSDKWRGSAELDAELWSWFVDRFGNKQDQGELARDPACGDSVFERGS